MVELANVGRLKLKPSVEGAGMGTAAAVEKEEAEEEEEEEEDEEEKAAAVKVDAKEDSEENMAVENWLVGGRDVEKAFGGCTASKVEASLVSRTGCG